MTVVLFYAILIASWQMVFDMGLFPKIIFPSPLMVVRRLWELAFSDGLLWPSVRATFLHMVVGFGLSAVVGLLFGLAMGIHPLTNQCLKSLFVGLQTLPSAAWVPISIIIFGLSDKGIYFVIVMSSMAAIAISAADSVAQIPPLYLRAARTLGTPRYAMSYRVILPASLPRIVSGIKLGWTLGWHGAVSAELIKVGSIGLGNLLYMGRELFDVSQVVGVMLMTILFGFLVDRFVFGWIEYRIRLRWGLIPHS